MFQCHFSSVVAKAILALPQWLDQCDGILILDPKKGIIYISATLLKGLWCLVRGKYKITLFQLLAVIIYIFSNQ